MTTLGQMTPNDKKPSPVMIAFFDIGKGQVRVMNRNERFYVEVESQGEEKYLYSDGIKWVNVSNNPNRYMAIQEAMIFAGIMEYTLRPEAEK